MFQWLQNLGNIAPDEMERVFNMGIGMTIITNPYFAESIQRQLAHQRITSFVIGEVVEGKSSVVYAS